MSGNVSGQPNRTVKVLVVDDSAAMRALFSDLLEQTKGIIVVGAAASADQAREMIPEVKPDVLTLDIDMPGTNGLEFLEELMKKRPMPVVILSALAQKGTKTTKQAMELGAVSCFGKPLKANSAQFAKSVEALGQLVHEAAEIDLNKHLDAVRTKAAAKRGAASQAA